MKEITRLLAYCVETIWGGVRLKEEYHKQSDLPKIAESWELSAYPGKECVIRDGTYAGYTFLEYLEAAGREVLGSKASGDWFPILIKIIDAARELSLQVHPDDAYGFRVEGEPGKTEIWYVLDAEEGAEVIFGFAKDVTKEAFARGIEDHSVLSMVNHVKVKRGDVIFVPAGTVHGIGAGITMAEIQENSNITYRIYDYGRVGADGKPRQLHVEQAKEVIRLTKQDVSVKPSGETISCGTYQKTELASCDYFTVTEYRYDGAVRLSTDETSFAALTFSEGAGEVVCQHQTLPVQKGDTLFVPAGINEYEVNGSGAFLLTTL